ncbi:MAG: phage portal protein [Alphaproteobacteria bacterium]
MNSSELRRRVNRRLKSAGGRSAPRFAASAMRTAPDFVGHGRRSGVMGSTGLGPSSSALSYSETTRRRSRFQIINNTLAKRGTEILTSQVIGKGMRPKLHIKNKQLARRLQQRFDRWARKADPMGRQTFWQQQALAFKSMVEGGDSFARFRPRRVADGLPVPMQLQLLEAEMCPASKHETRTGGAKVVGGIEFDALDRPAAYHFYKAHPGDGFLGAGDLLPRPVPASNVIHLISMGRIGEPRGISWFAQVLVKMGVIDLYDDAEGERKMNAAMFSGVFKAPPGADGDEVPIGGPPTSATDKTDDGGQDWEEVEPEAIEAGSFPVLPPGWEFDLTTPGDVGNNYDAFMKTQLRIIAGGMFVLYQQLTGDYDGVSDRTYRAALQDHRRMCEGWQGVTAHQFCNPVWNRFIDLVAMLGLEDLDGHEPEDLYDPQWVPQAWPHIHPVQDVQAAQLKVRSGFASRAQVVTELGGNIDEVDAEIADERAREDEQGLTYDTNPGKVSRAGGVNDFGDQPVPDQSQQDEDDE